MRYKKMTNPTDGINQTNKQLSTVEDQLCCINDNLITGVPIAAGPQLDAFGRLRVRDRKSVV